MATMTLDCLCAGRQHLVCQPHWIRPRPRVTLPRFTGKGEAVAWAMRELRKLGEAPDTFTYRPPAVHAVNVNGTVDCACKGTRHVVCLAKGKWASWLKGAHAFLDRETLRPELVDEQTGEPVEDAAAA